MQLKSFMACGPQFHHHSHRSSKRVKLVAAFTFTLYTLAMYRFPYFFVHMVASDNHIVSIITNTKYSTHENLQIIAYLKHEILTPRKLLTHMVFITKQDILYIIPNTYVHTVNTVLEKISAFEMIFRIFFKELQPLKTLITNN